VTATRTLPPGTVVSVHSTRGDSGIWSVYRAERRKLSSQIAIRLLALVCLLGAIMSFSLLSYIDARGVIPGEFGPSWQAQQLGRDGRTAAALSP